MTDKEKIIEYLDFKGFSKNSFYKRTGFSTGFLDKGSSLGVDKLRIIIDNYQDFNPLWLLTGNSEMLLKDTAQLAGVAEPPTDHQQLPIAIEDIIANKVVERLKPMLESYDAMGAHLAAIKLDAIEKKLDKK
ncbi:MAG: hypothetical protein COA88_15505 [Kordia sp.]|nr:MAG: hypothetical protein COA88_15505 [Kordia sp.]